MRRGEIYRSVHETPERGNKPGYYVVVSRDFVAQQELIETVMCAPIYSEILGIATEVPVDSAHGVRHASAIRCDFVMLMFKRKLTRYVGTLPDDKIEALNRALAVALGLPVTA